MKSFKLFKYALSAALGTFRLAYDVQRAEEEEEERKAEVNRLVDKMLYKRRFGRGHGLLTPEEEAIRKSFTPKEGCHHIKGAAAYRFGIDKCGAGPWATKHKDYNVSDHTFIDGTRVIKCLTCGIRWTKESPDWNKALYMVANSSNSRSSSEVPLESILRKKEAE